MTATALELPHATPSTSGPASSRTRLATNARHCVIGAGPGGIAVARAFQSAGIPFDLVERHEDVGGIWDIDNPGTPLYESAHLISSSGGSHFAGAPMPADYPDFPNHRQMLDYLRATARAAGICEHLLASTTVERARETGSAWRVHLRRRDGHEQVRDYAGLICATGTTWRPKWPSWPGPFSGEIIHSSQYRSASRFAGRRVLVVGAGNSGCDIACDAARTADRALISTRRGYHFVPKFVFGMPVDAFSAQSEILPWKLRRPLFEAVVRMHTGDVTKLGLPAPDHRILESHPIINDQLIHHLRHGDVVACRDVERLDGDTVLFQDGRREKVDLIVCATGYETSTPYLEEGTLPMKGGRPDLFMNIFSREHEGLFAIGFLESNSGLFKLFDEMAHVIAQAVLARRRPSDFEAFRRMVATESPDLSGGIRYVESDRHAQYVNIEAYRKALRRLARRAGWPRFDPDRLKLHTAPDRAAARDSA